METPSGTLNVNTYATKKTVSAGLLDIALLTTNASQIKFVLSAGEEYEYYSAALGLLITSMILQAVVGTFLLVVGTFNINDEKQQRTANILNNIASSIIFIITFLNIVIGVFGFQYSGNVAGNVAG